MVVGRHRLRFRGCDRSDVDGPSLKRDPLHASCPESVQRAVRANGHVVDALGSTRVRVVNGVQALPRRCEVGEGEDLLVADSDYQASVLRGEKRVAPRVVRNRHDIHQRIVQCRLARRQL